MKEEDSLPEVKEEDSSLQVKEEDNMMIKIVGGIIVILVLILIVKAMI